MVCAVCGRLQIGFQVLIVNRIAVLTALALNQAVKVAYSWELLVL